MMRLFGASTPETPTVRALRLRAELAAAELELARASNTEGGSTKQPENISQDGCDEDTSPLSLDSTSLIHDERRSQSSEDESLSSTLWHAITRPISTAFDADPDPFDEMDDEERARLDFNFDSAYETPWAREEVSTRRG